nr:PREDICTED: zinc finger and BTB domain-containing protein 24-like [Linepithema humile]
MKRYSARDKCYGVNANGPPSSTEITRLLGFFAGLGWSGDGSRRASRSANSAATTTTSSTASDVPAPLTPHRRPRLHCPSRHAASRNNNHPSIGSGGGLAHHDRRHNCSRCGKSYKNAYILKRHLLYECGKAPSFSCPHCAFSSKYERNLKAHINHRHVDLQSALPGIAVGQQHFQYEQHWDNYKPFVCGRCGRKYKWKASLQCHQRDECGKEPQYKCYYCDYKTKIRSNWTRHEKTHMKQRGRKQTSGVTV